MNNKLRHFYPALILLLFAILAYWQASFMFWTFKWDMLDVVLPWRYHTGECLQNGIFPFWNPYQQTGYPIHADLQCPVWYPVTWIVGSLTGYNILILHLLFVLYIFAAGFGMYKLAYYFSSKKIESVIAGTMCMLSGFFVAHGQHFFAIIGAAFVPLVIYFYLKLLESPNIFNLCKLSLFTYLLISGYQALTIITAYLLLTLLVFFIVKNIKNRNKLFSLIKYQFFFGIVIALMCLPIIISLIQISDFTSRFTEGVTLSQAQKFPFSPQSLISIIFPFSTTTGDGFFKTDISMRNAYIGFFGAVFFILALLRKKRSIEWVFLGFGFICLLASFGNYLPVRKFLADFFPMMKQFRMPGYFVVFTIITALISVSMHISAIINSLKNAKYKSLFIVVIVFAGILFINLVSYLKTGSDLAELIKTGDFRKLVTDLTIFDRIFIQSIFHIMLLFILLFAILKIDNLVLFKRILVLLVFFDLFTSVNLNSYFTTFSDYSPLSLHSDISKYPKGFPLPYNEKIGETTDRSMSEWPLWRNLGNFQKRITFDGFTSLLFNNYIYLADEQPVLKDSILANYFIYFSDKVFPFDSLNAGHVFSSKDIFTEADVYQKIKPVTLQVSETDTIAIKDFSPNKMRFIAENKEPVVLTLLQEYYRGWKLYIDGKQGDIFTSNKLYMSAILSPGSHRVEFRYSNNLILISALVTALIFSILLIYLIYVYYKKRNMNFIPAFTAFILFIFAITLFSCRNVIKNKYNRLYDNFTLKLTETAGSFPKDSAAIILNADRMTGSFSRNYNAHLFRFKTEPDFTELRNFISGRTEPYLIYGNFNALNPPDVKYYILDNYPCAAEESNYKGNQIIVYKRSHDCRPEKYFRKIENGFEDKNNLWSANAGNLDSACVYSGNYSYRLDSIAIYSPTYQGSFNDLSIKNPGHLTIDISAFIFMKEGSEPLIVFSKESVLKSNIWKGYNIRKHFNTNSKWIKARYTIRLPKGYNKNDKFKIYIWNNSKSEFYIDNMEIKFDTI